MNLVDKVKKIVKSVWLKIKWKRQVSMAVKEAKSCALAISYFPEKEHKPEKQRIEENIAWAKKFSEFRAPEYKQAVELTCRAHKTLYGIPSIGWDIAISDHGPVFIEGNDNWEISLNQAGDRPLRMEWEKVIS